MFVTVALVLIAWWVLGLAVALVVGRFIALADARGAGSHPSRLRPTREQWHA